MSATDEAAVRPAAPARVGAWQQVSVEAVTRETYRARTLRLAVPEWRPFRPGQHVDVRLTAPDGYQAQRSYSIASPPEASGVLELTVELVEDGEVSPWFMEIAQPDDSFELRGPIGGPFTWSVGEGGPLLLVAGGSGVVPLMSMLRHRDARRDTVPALLVYSSRSLEDVIYREELEALDRSEGGPQVLHTLTRARPDRWSGYERRVDRAILGDALERLGGVPRVFVCGPTPFVESVATALVASDVGVERIRTERFGPSG